MGKMIVLVGESGSGKTTIQKELGKLGTKKVVTCTTRPMRVGEKDGEDYIFLSDKEFQKMIDDNGFVEHAEYRGWKYGTPRKSCGKENTCVALTPAGLRALQKSGIEHLSFYISVDRRTRLISLLKRGDDIEEAYRRNLCDEGQFDGVSGEVDFVVKNDGFNKTASELAKKIFITCIVSSGRQYS